MNEQQLYKSLKASGVPRHLHGGIVRYLVSGIKPGAYLCSVLSNQLWTSITQCSSEDFCELHALTLWIIGNAPVGSVGCRSNVENWIIAKAKEYGVTA